MKTIKQHIQNNSFVHFYLLFGEDSYMKKLYCNKLKTALLYGSDEMNFSYFTGNKIDINKFIDIAETLPFFSDKRVLFFEDTGLFSESNTLSEYIKDSIDTTYFIFSETKVDKRNKLYKTIKDIGYIVEMNGLTDYELMAFAKSEIKKSEKILGDYEAKYLIEKIGTDMNTIVNECAKLSSFTFERDKITTNDIDSICTTLLENKIFDMLDCVSSKNKDKALALYNNLMILKESPAKILRLVTRQYNILYNILINKKAGVDDKTICSKVKIPPFAIKKYSQQLSGYTQEELVEIIDKCLDVEQSFKTGLLDEQIGVEMLIIKFSSR